MKFYVIPDLIEAVDPARRRKRLAGVLQAARKAAKSYTPGDTSGIWRAQKAKNIYNKRRMVGYPGLSPGVGFMMGRHGSNVSRARYSTGYGMRDFKRVARKKIGKN